MYLAIGRNTQKVYAQNKHKACVMRELEEKYPYPTGDGQKSKVIKNSEMIYPEPLLIVRVAK